ncbi:MAG: hypothetical protein HZA50_11830 [Planctomycetes bacterium]|nr:hypothetical protein [Planctomycetota bacterium]
MKTTIVALACLFVAALSALAQTSRPASAPASQPASGPAEDIAILVQCGEKAKPIFDKIRGHIIDHLKTLSSNQRFYIILWEGCRTDDPKFKDHYRSLLLEGPEKNFVSATKENLEKTEKLMVADFLTRSGGNPYPAVDRALALLRTSKASKRIIFMVHNLGDLEVVDDNAGTKDSHIKILPKIATQAKAARIKVDSISFEAVKDTEGIATGYLEKNLSTPTGGTVTKIDISR